MEDDDICAQDIVVQYGLSNSDIEDRVRRIPKLYKIFLNVYALDEFLHCFACDVKQCDGQRDVACIVNTQPLHVRLGGHWQAVYVKREDCTGHTSKPATVHWYCSLGWSPGEDVKQVIEAVFGHNSIQLVNETQIQLDGSMRCGEFCLAYLSEMVEMGEIDFDMDDCMIVVV
jgi:hypothetical protein